jgi:hypothetical protein
VYEMMYLMLLNDIPPAHLLNYGYLDNRSLAALISYIVN